MSTTVIKSQINIEDEMAFDLLKELNIKRSNVFLFRMNSRAMEAEGIFFGDILVVDCNLAIAGSGFVLVEIDGKLFLKKSAKEITASTGQKWKSPENLEQHSSFPNRSGNKVLGVVTFVIHALGRRY